MILNNFTKIWVLEASLPDFHRTTLSWIPVQTGSSFKYRQSQAVLPLSSLTVYTSHDHAFLSLMCLSFLLQTWYSISRGQTRKLWSSDADYRIQETHVQSVGPRKVPHNQKEVGESLSKGRHGFLSSLCHCLGSHLLFPWMVGRPGSKSQVLLPWSFLTSIPPLI